MRARVYTVAGCSWKSGVSVMPVVEWNINFVVGIKDIDQHHRQLVDLLNDSYAELKTGAGVEKIQSVVDELVKYADYHFSCEERLMMATSYPDFAEHKKEHDMFARQAVDFQEGFKDGSVPAVAVLSFLSNWITHHILQTDVKFGMFVDSHNIRHKVYAALNSKPEIPR